MQQFPLFDDPADAPAPLPPGCAYEAGFLSAAEEAALIDTVRGLPLSAARYKHYTARRRVLSFGGSFDYDTHRLLPAPPLPDSLAPLRDKVARWLGVAPGALAHVLVAEYAPGTPLGWHRDVPDFELVAGVSLGSDAVLRFRPWPHEVGQRTPTLRLVAERRSVYRLGGPARWAWQHSVAPVAALRWSITLRTLRQPLPRGEA